MMRGLSRRQKHVLDTILEIVRRDGRFPSIREIGRVLGISSPATVSQHLQALLRKKYLERRGRHYVLPEHLRRASGVPVVGRVAAGAPIFSSEHVEEWLELDDAAPDARGRSFAVKVMGDSMVDDGILDGDYVLVEPEGVPPNGAIVVAYLGPDQEVTVKRLHRLGGGIELRPSNPAFEPVRIPRGDPHFRLAGRVVGLVRRF